MQAGLQSCLPRCSSFWAVLQELFLILHLQCGMLESNAPSSGTGADCCLLLAAGSHSQSAENLMVLVFLLKTPGLLSMGFTTKKHSDKFLKSLKRQVVNQKHLVGFLKYEILRDPAITLGFGNSQDSGIISQAVSECCPAQGIFCS